MRGEADLPLECWVAGLIEVLRPIVDAVGTLVGCPRACEIVTALLVSRGVRGRHVAGHLVEVF